MRWYAQITDSKNVGIKIEFDLNTLTNNGTWRSLDFGLLTVNSGHVGYQDSSGTISTKHCMLKDPADDTWGIRLTDFCDLWGQNSGGSGLAVPAWCIRLAPGAIEWIKYRV